MSGPRSFRPGLAPPPDIPGPVWVFAFRRRELLMPVDRPLAPLSALDVLTPPPLRTQYLGVLDGSHSFSAELPADAEPPPGMTFRDLRMLYGRIDPDLHAVAARAVQIVDWDRTHQFCGACGEPTVPAEQERSRACPSCGLGQYPRLSPAIIVVGGAR